MKFAMLIFYMLGATLAANDLAPFAALRPALQFSIALDGAAFYAKLSKSPGERVFETARRLSNVTDSLDWQLSPVVKEFWDEIDGKAKVNPDYAKWLDAKMIVVVKVVERSVDVGRIFGEMCPLTVDTGETTTQEWSRRKYIRVLLKEDFPKINGCSTTIVSITEKDEN